MGTNKYVMNKIFNKGIVEIYISGSFFNKYDIITTHDNCNYLILDTPKITKWKLFKQFISFGLYKIPNGYKCRQIRK